ncbi:MAG: hypothetical protein LBM13_02840 [Candidatus Ancillula sp.]|jgi:hypothetical protein|nr:hypothetical protein [Candidatus Ancillula sp.]
MVAKNWTKLVPGLAIKIINEHTIKIGSDPNHTLVLTDLTQDEINYILFLSKVNINDINSGSEKKINENSKNQLYSLFDKYGFITHKLPSDVIIGLPSLDILGFLIAIALANQGIKHIISSDKLHFTENDRTNSRLFMNYDVSRQQSLSRIEVVNNYFFSHSIDCYIEEKVTKKPDLILPFFENNYIPQSCNLLLGEQIPHVPILNQGSRVLIGPLIKTGKNPCVNCLYNQFTKNDEYMYIEPRRRVSLTNIIASAVSELTRDYFSSKLDDFPSRMLIIETSPLHFSYTDVEYSTECHCRDFLQTNYD